MVNRGLNGRDKRLGIGLWGGMSVNDLVDVVKYSDNHGYESAYIIESFSDPFCFLSACARETERIKLGTGVATVFTRNPTSIAIASATVDAISEGRFRLGLGVGHREIHKVRDDVEVERPSPFINPLERLRETTELTHALIGAAYRGENVNFSGSVFQLNDYEPWMRPHRERIEVFYGALSESTFELAGEIADGIAPIFTPIEFVEKMKAAVTRGAERVGRDPAEIDIQCYLPTSVSDDVELARLAAKYDVAIHMSSFRYYRNYFVRQGMGDAVDKISDLIDTGNFDKAIEAVSDEMVEAVTVFGTPEMCQARIQEYRDAGVGLPIIFPIFEGFLSYLPVPGSHKKVIELLESLAPS